MSGRKWFPPPNDPPLGRKADRRANCGWNSSRSARTKQMFDSIARSRDQTRGHGLLHRPGDDPGGLSRRQAPKAAAARRARGQRQDPICHLCRRCCRHACRAAAVLSRCNRGQGHRSLRREPAASLHGVFKRRARKLADRSGEPQGAGLLSAWSTDACTRMRSAVCAAY